MVSKYLHAQDQLTACLIYLGMQAASYSTGTIVILGMHENVPQ
jgi:hypothetical protein